MEKACFKRIQELDDQAATISTEIRGVNSSTGKIDIAVKIKEKYYKQLPVPSIVSRHALAIIWSFYGDRIELSRLMQRLNHKTRAYFINAKLLKEFLKPPISEILLSATEEEKAQSSENHIVDAVALATSLDKIIGRRD